MVVIRRFLLIAFLLVVPPFVVALFYAASAFALQSTNRTIGPQVLFYAAAIEYLVFLLVAFLDVRNRW